MYKDKEKQKEANRKASQKYRQGMVEAVSKRVGMTHDRKLYQGMTQGMTHPKDVTGIAERLTDPVWRPRLESICESLGNLSKEVFLDGITLDMWGELLSVTA